MIFIFHVLSVTLYVTLDLTSPKNPWEELDLSKIEKVIESSDRAVTSQKRNDQLFVPLWRVLSPSFFCVVYSTPPMEYFPLPMRLA